MQINQSTSELYYRILMLEHKIEELTELLTEEIPDEETSAEQTLDQIYNSLQSFYGRTKI